MATIDERIASLELKLQQEKAKRSQIEARKRSAAKKKQHAEDTRRKILVGAMVLNTVDAGTWPRDKMISMLNATLTRDDDRAASAGVEVRAPVKVPAASGPSMPRRRPRPAATPAATATATVATTMRGHWRRRSRKNVEPAASPTV